MGNKILLIDDSVTVQKIITLTFSDEGFDVVTVDSGDEAINRLAYMRPALVMADVSIPGRNGYDVCAFIKGNPELKNIPVILLVPGFEAYDAERANRAGADCHLTKPFQSIRSLIATVKSLMGTGGSGSLTAVGQHSATDDNLLEIEPADTGPLMAPPAEVTRYSAGFSSSPGWTSGAPAGAVPAPLAGGGRPELATGPDDPNDPNDPDDEASRVDRLMEQLVERVATRIEERLVEESARTRMAMVERLDSISSDLSKLANLSDVIVARITTEIAALIPRRETDDPGRAVVDQERVRSRRAQRFEDPDQLLELDDL